MVTSLVGALERALPEGDLLLLDSVVVISYLEGGDRWSEASRIVLEDLVRPGRNGAVVSAISVMESLVRPMRQVPPNHQAVLDFFAHWPNLEVLPADLRVAQTAAFVRARHGLRSPDALVVGTGIVAGVKHLVTGDDTWKKRLADAVLVPATGVCYLGDFL